jgi:hypothetical protein
MFTKTYTIVITKFVRKASTVSAVGFSLIRWARKVCQQCIV